MPTTIKREIKNGINCEQDSYNCSKSYGNDVVECDDYGNGYIVQNKDEDFLETKILDSQSDIIVDDDCDDLIDKMVFPKPNPNGGDDEISDSDESDSSDGDSSDEDSSDGDDSDGDDSDGDDSDGGYDDDYGY